MTLNERIVGDVIIFDMTGRMRHVDGDDDLLKQAVERAVEAKRIKIMLNMTELTFMDSAGLGEMVRDYTMVTRRGGAFKLLNLQQRIIDLLMITKLLAVFDCFEDEAEALASFATEPKQAQAPQNEG